MIRIPVGTAAGEYQVLVGRGLLGELAGLLEEQGLHGRVRLIADDSVYQVLGERVAGGLSAAGRSVELYRVAPGEPSKSLEESSRIYDWLVETGTERRDLVLALGGGVVGDLAGFVAATFLRGLRLVQLPTSLLAQVDSSVGGKVAVNHPRGKNLIGAFYPPSLVVADLDSLTSLPRRELSAALGEVVKHGLVLDQEYFHLLEREGDALLEPGAEAMSAVVTRSVELKAGVVQADEREAGLRAVLNYGHTIGHGVEGATDYSVYRHGEAVAIGMAGAARMAVEMGMLPAEVAERQDRLLARLGLPLTCPGVDPGRILETMLHDKKASQGKLAWVLLEGIGRAAVRRDVPVELMERVVRDLASG